MRSEGGRGIIKNKNQTVLRINTLVLKMVLANGATTWKPALMNMEAVPWVDSLPKARGCQVAMG